jgi:hypothetical protein
VLTGRRHVEGVLELALPIGIAGDHAVGVPPTLGVPFVTGSHRRWAHREAVMSAVHPLGVQGAEEIVVGVVLHHQHDDVLDLGHRVRTRGKVGERERVRGTKSGSAEHREGGFDVRLAQGDRRSGIRWVGHSGDDGPSGKGACAAEKRPPIYAPSHAQATASLAQRCRTPDATPRVSSRALAAIDPRGIASPEHARAGMRTCFFREGIRPWVSVGAPM